MLRFTPFRGTTTTRVHLPSRPSALWVFCDFCINKCLLTYLLILNSLSIVRPPDVVVGELRFYCDSIFYFLIFYSSIVSYTPSSLNGTQPKPATCSEVSAIRKCMYEFWGIPSSKNRGPKPPILDVFRRLRSLTVTLTAYVFGMKHDVHNRASALEITTGLLHCLKMSWTLVDQRLKIGP